MLSLQNILNSTLIAADIEKKLDNQVEFLRGGISLIYLSLQNKWKPCHGARSAAGHVISGQHWKSNFDLTEIVNNYRLNRGTEGKIARFISKFYLKLYIKF